MAHLKLRSKSNLCTKSCSDIQTPGKIKMPPSHAFKTNIACQVPRQISRRERSRTQIPHGPILCWDMQNLYFLIKGNTVVLLRNSNMRGERGTTSLFVAFDSQGYW